MFGLVVCGRTGCVWRYWQSVEGLGVCFGTGSVWRESEFARGDWESVEKLRVVKGTGSGFWNWECLEGV